jgi:hypothetical protein
MSFGGSVFWRMQPYFIYWNLHIFLILLRVWLLGGPINTIDIIVISPKLILGFPSAIRTWNNLPAVLISVPTLEAFKVELVHV